MTYKITAIDLKGEIVSERMCETLTTVEAHVDYHLKKGHTIHCVPGDRSKLFKEHCQDVDKIPIGLVPRKIHREHRFYDVCDAISRYYNANLQIPVEWIEEYNELLEVLDNEDCL